MYGYGKSLIYFIFTTYYLLIRESQVPFFILAMSGYGNNGSMPARPNKPGVLILKYLHICQCRITYMRIFVMQYLHIDEKNTLF